MKIGITTYVGKLAQSYVSKHYPNHTLVSLHQQPGFLRARNRSKVSSAKVKAIVLNRLTGAEEVLMLKQGDLA